MRGTVREAVMSVIHVPPCSPAWTVRVFLIFRGSPANTHGATCSMDQPCSHLSFQKRMRLPSPAVKVTDATKKSSVAGSVADSRLAGPPKCVPGPFPMYAERLTLQLQVWDTKASHVRRPTHLVPCDQTLASSYR